MTDFLSYVWIVIEVLVTILGLVIAVSKKKTYGWFIALTFAIYTVYDGLPFTDFYVSSETLDILFTVASLSILYAVWSIYKRP